MHLEFLCIKIKISTSLKIKKIRRFIHLFSAYRDRLLDNGLPQGYSIMGVVINPTLGKRVTDRSNLKFHRRIAADRFPSERSLSRLLHPLEDMGYYYSKPGITRIL